MRYVTREFAHMETLERAKRWLTEVGFHPSRIEVHTHGTLRLTIKVEAGQAEEVERVLDAVAASDPDGSPSFWDHTHLHHGIAMKQAKPDLPASGAVPSETFDIGWRRSTPNARSPKPRPTPTSRNKKPTAITAIERRFKSPARPGTATRTCRAGRRLRSHVRRVSRNP